MWLDKHVDIYVQLIHKNEMIRGGFRIVALLRPGPQRLSELGLILAYIFELTVSHFFSS